MDGRFSFSLIHPFFQLVIILFVFFPFSLVLLDLARNGCDAVQTHMTNTRITDAEILERRYPVLLRRFAIRRGSGGTGLFRGGNGVIR